MKDRKAEITVLGDVLKDVLGDALGPKATEGLRAMRVVETWCDLLGTAMGRYSTAERFESGTLYVTIRSAALRQELFMNRTAVIEKINKRFGIDVVKQLVIR